jgi:hypothetical protein
VDSLSALEKLEKNGWTRRFVACEPRLSEVVETYREVGFEVRLESLPPASECKTCPGEEGRDECRVCFDGFEEKYKVIFTRPKK